MPSEPALLAVDWGTSSLRAWVLDRDGAVLRRHAEAAGVGALKPGAAEAFFRARIVPALQAEGLPALLCGMVGSTLGWSVAPYAACPADGDAVAAGLVPVGERIAIVPGLRCDGPFGAPDVMRGEETQILGWLAGDPARRRGRHVLCLPGTHSKWVLVEEGRVVRFATSMTGELFELLRRQGTLASDAPADDHAAFARGLIAAGDGGALAARLFGVRARAVTGAMPGTEAPAFLSGLLIGAEISSLSRLPGFDEGPVHLVGAPVLTGLYARALGPRPHQEHEGEAAAIAGLLDLSRRWSHP
ncbi:MAG TPA: 2-dehydro-3-deoxygalactonokinase [Azospirillaceae bacterium]|nr:2-dehydro-3-deoxygalactonokinase [Azospirillaceae bacterium]